MAYDNFLIDKRVVERNIAKGLVDPNEYQRIVEALPDLESNCVRVSLDGEPAAEAGTGEAAQAEGAEQPAAPAAEAAPADAAPAPAPSVGGDEPQ